MQKSFYSFSTRKIILIECLFQHVNLCFGSIR
uniref:Uncharacterized protein n=1 Tax=Siphoviridae sp. ct2vX3 TaxID=2825318 RepID=A0A8S5PXD9_9CAUD|nr:MAG TPA: hypothetical protein [Siphoviridae sp. ct2vX3]